MSDDDGSAGSEPATPEGETSPPRPPDTAPTGGAHPDGQPSPAPASDATPAADPDPAGQPSAAPAPDTEPMPAATSAPAPGPATPGPWDTMLPGSGPGSAPPPPPAPVPAADEALFSTWGWVGVAALVAIAGVIIGALIFGGDDDDEASPPSSTVVVPGDEDTGGDDNLQRQVDALTAERDLLQTELNQVNASLTETQAALNSVTAERDALQTQLDEVQPTIDQLEADLEAANQALEEVTAERDALQELVDGAGDVTTMPSLAGQSVAQIEALADDNDWVLVTENASSPPAGAAVGDVVGQAPTEGTLMTNGSVVVISVVPEPPAEG